MIDTQVNDILYEKCNKMYRISHSLNVNGTRDVVIENHGVFLLRIQFPAGMSQLDVLCDLIKH